jgi:hypothetical protein
VIFVVLCRRRGMLFRAFCIGTAASGLFVCELFDVVLRRFATQCR